MVRGRSDYLTSRYSERKGDLAARALATASGAVEASAAPVIAPVRDRKTACC
jgi:arsenic resistance protein ArsH